MLLILYWITIWKHLFPYSLVIFLNCYMKTAVAGVLWLFTEMLGLPRKTVSYCMYSTQVQSVFMLTTLCTLPHYFVHNYLVVRLLAITTSTHLSLLLYTVNINLCSIVYSVLHRVIIIISGCGSIYQEWSSLIRPFPWGDIYHLKIISVPQESKLQQEETLPEMGDVCCMLY